MATGGKLEDTMNPHPAGWVGKPGDVGVVEIQNIMIITSCFYSLPLAYPICLDSPYGPSTLGIQDILKESYFRVCGALGFNLQAKDCPKQASTPNKKCIAASLLLHITESASAYMENVWAWIADHDLDALSQDQVDIYSARSILIESKGPIWLYGASSEITLLPVSAPQGRERGYEYDPD
ncbi:uncharacterized protein BDW43DRAFT_308392 [Aspergillus alliaceus]|uniref:uncharacterized protein n=1 Tax=Petromyces alliaceus TaxID=209559 RepID=UPI0012A5209C|nr:uncharacterized protein BDW43DRAFT_308392 [Aspergillus alliaceus]KAB8236122.1 hypothetical protein BDW43DRAFT_308392 [Aspergillus alliaceus]